ncbi:MAG: hypothetical protein ACOC2W_01585 [bacterium]
MNGYIIKFKDKENNWYTETIIAENISACKKIIPKKGYYVYEIETKNNIFIEPDRNNLIRKYFQMKEKYNYEDIFNYFTDIYDKFYEFYGNIDANVKDKKIYGTFTRIIALSSKRMLQNSVSLML